MAKKYELTQTERDTIWRLVLALGKDTSTKALEDVALDLFLGFGPGTKDKASIHNVRAALLNAFSTTFESKEVSEVMNDNPAWIEDYRANLERAKASINAALLKLEAR